MEVPLVITGSNFYAELARRLMCTLVTRSERILTKYLFYLRTAPGLIEDVRWWVAAQNILCLDPQNAVERLGDGF